MYKSGQVRLCCYQKQPLNLSGCSCHMFHTDCPGKFAPHSHIETQDNRGFISIYTSEQWEGIIITAVGRKCGSLSGLSKLLPKCHTATPIPKQALKYNSTMCSKEQPEIFKHQQQLPSYPTSEYRVKLHTSDFLLKLYVDMWPNLASEMREALGTRSL